jgi:hypothetical protein
MAYDQGPGFLTMQTIFYADARLETDDAVAEAVLDYAEKLAADGSCAIVRIPIVSHGRPAISRLLIGTGLPVAVQTGFPADDTLDGYVMTVDPFEVRRTLNSISERMKLLDRSVVAHPFSPDTIPGDPRTFAGEDRTPTSSPPTEAGDSRVEEWTETSAESSPEALAVNTTRSTARTTVGNVTRMTVPTGGVPDSDEPTAAITGAREESGDSEL